jgi:hypothetical protein
MGSAFYTCSCRNLCWKADKARQVRPGATCPQCLQPLTRFFGQLTIPQAFGARDLPATHLIPLPMYRYRCVGKPAHHWETTVRVLQPKQTGCPFKTLFGATCDKPLDDVTSMFIPGAPKWQPLPEVLKTLAPLEPKEKEKEKLVRSPMEIVPRVMEVVSQRDLTAILHNASGISFLCRDGQFRHTPKAPTVNREPEEFVDEPGFMAGHPVCLRLHALLVGRNEVADFHPSDFFASPFVKGGVTYPDFVCKQGEDIYAVELKTPPTMTMAAYLDEGFYIGTSSFFGSRSIEEEIEARAAHLPPNYRQMFAFDLANMGRVEEFGATIAALQKAVVGKHATFWKQIKSFLFVGPDRSVTTMSQDSLREHGTSQKTLGLASSKLAV